MSSIDKYVAGEARKYNPDVKVEHIDGRLVGKINGREVFSIADRYGYLNKEEESIIKSSMLRYEEEEKERILKEYLKSVLQSQPKTIVLDGVGVGAKTTVEKAKTINEAGQLAKQILMKK